MPKPAICLDPGHGDTRGAPNYDAGAIFGDRHEAEAALEMALTCKFVLSDAWNVFLTRNGLGGGKPSLEGRVQFARNVRAVAFVSIHYDIQGGSSLVYYSPNSVSKALADEAGRAFGYGEAFERPSSSSRFGRLYIDDFDPTDTPTTRPAVLLEVGPLDQAPPAGDAGRDARLAWAQKLNTALASLLPAAADAF
jgi:N-acetylmuramoyl-L-alanine amidase